MTSNVVSPFPDNVRGLLCELTDYSNWNPSPPECYRQELVQSFFFLSRIYVLLSFKTSQLAFLRTQKHLFYLSETTNPFLFNDVWSWHFFSFRKGTSNFLPLLFIQVFKITNRKPLLSNTRKFRGNDPLTMSAHRKLSFDISPVSVTTHYLCLFSYTSEFITER